MKPVKYDDLQTLCQLFSLPVVVVVVAVTTRPPQYSQQSGLSFSSAQISPCTDASNCSQLTPGLSPPHGGPVLEAYGSNCRVAHFVRTSSFTLIDCLNFHCKSLVLDCATHATCHMAGQTSRQRCHTLGAA